MQDFEPDLMLADFVLAGGSALADKLGIPKAIMVPFFGSGMMNNNSQLVSYCSPVHITAS